MELDSHHSDSQRSGLDASQPSPTLIGIAGTRGKTVVAHMLRAVLDGDEAFAHAGILSTLESYDGITRVLWGQPAPTADDLRQHLRNARKAGLSHLVVELSDEVIERGAVADLGLDVACLLGAAGVPATSQESLDAELSILDRAYMAVVDLDCPHAEQALARARRCERVITFSAHDRYADVWAEDIDPSYGLVRFTAHTPTWESYVVTPMPGVFNASNALATIAVAEALGIGQEQVVNRFYLVRVPGRTELLMTPDRHVTGIVDSADDKPSYQRIFSAMREEFPGFAIIALVVAPGARGELVQEAARWADHLICVEEDAASESVEQAVFRAVELAYSLDRPALVCLLANDDETRRRDGRPVVSRRPVSDIFSDAVRRYHKPTTEP